MHATLGKKNSKCESESDQKHPQITIPVWQKKQEAGKNEYKNLLMQWNTNKVKNVLQTLRQKSVFPVEIKYDF